MTEIALDTNIYIDNMKNRINTVKLKKIINNRKINLISIVAMELLQGVGSKKHTKAQNTKEKAKVNKFIKGYEKKNRIILPSRNSYYMSGKVLSDIRIGENYEKSGLARLTKDVLIATTCIDKGFQLITKDNDYKIIQKYLKSLDVIYL